MPDVLDLRRILADQKRLQVFIDRRRHHPRPLRERRTAQAIQPRLVGRHLDHDQPNAGRRGQDRLDIGDFQFAARRVARLRSGSRLLPGESRAPSGKQRQGNPAGERKLSEPVATVHGEVPEERKGTRIRRVQCMPQIALVEETREKTELARQPAAELLARGLSIPPSAASRDQNR